MKSILFCCALCVIHLSCIAKDSEQKEETAIDALEVHCGYDLGEETINSITSSKVKKENFNSTKFTHLEFKMALKLGKKKTNASIRFNCITEGDFSSEPPFLTPTQLIRQEDAGGRYFRHIAWQKKITGNNWDGLIAYSDYFFGDAQKSKTYYYLICRTASKCFDFEIDPTIKLTQREQENALDLIRRISYKK